MSNFIMLFAQSFEAIIVITIKTNNKSKKPDIIQ